MNKVPYVLAKVPYTLGVVSQYVYVYTHTYIHMYLKCPMFWQNRPVFYRAVEWCGKEQWCNGDNQNIPAKEPCIPAKEW